MAENLLVDSWPIFPQNLSLLCLGNLGLYLYFVHRVFGYVMVVVVVVHETENETIIRVARDNLLCWGFSISPQILPWQSQEIP